MLGKMVNRQQNLQVLKFQGGEKMKKRKKEKKKLSSAQV